MAITNAQQSAAAELVIVAPAWRQESASDASPEDSSLAMTLPWTESPVAPWQHVLLHALGIDLPSSAGKQIAAVRASLAGLRRQSESLELPARHDAESRWLCADPVHLQADRDSAVLWPAEALELDDEECRQLQNSLNDFLREDGLALEALAPTRWYLHELYRADASDASDASDADRSAHDWWFAHPRNWPVDSQAFQRVSINDPDTGASVSMRSRSTDPAAMSIEEDNLKRMASARRWRTLVSEIEMFLHAHPVNLERQARGALMVNSLWLWGHEQPLARAGSVPTVCTSHPFVSAIADYAGAEQVATSTAVHQRRYANSSTDVDASSGAAASSDENSSSIIVDLSMLAAHLRGELAALRHARLEFESATVQPALDALASGRWSRIRVETVDGYIAVVTAHDLGPGGANRLAHEHAWGLPIHDRLRPILKRVRGWLR